MINNNSQIFGVIAIVGGLIGACLIAYFIFFYQWGGVKLIDDQKNNATSTVVDILPDTPIVTNQKDEPVPTPPLDGPMVTDTQLGAQLMTKNFTERFGTYSNQQARTLDDGLKLICTTKMQAWLNNFFNLPENVPADYNNYIGMKTEAIAQKVLLLDEKNGSTTIMVSTKRTENKGGVDRIFNQDIKIELVKLGKAWKIDGAYWQ